MKKFVIASLALAAFAAPAFAGKAVEPSFTWAGFYIGGNVGYGWAKSDIISAAATNGLCWAPGCGATVTPNRNGFLGGAQVGYNWQYGFFVAGLEADLGYMTGSGTSILQGFPTTSGNNSPGFYGTGRARLGVAVNNFLVFVTGGAIAADLGARAVDNTHALNTSSTSTQWGWTLGGGVEYALTHHWSTKVDYLHYDLGTKQVGGTFGGATIQFFNVKNTGDLVRVGLNYKFGN